MNHGVAVATETSFSAAKKLYFVFKRLFDIIIGFVGMYLLIPIALIVKIAYLLNGDHNSIFYKQKRIGKNGKLFLICKFRTMVPNAEEKLKELLESDDKLKKEYTINKKLSKDPRITKIGRFLRRSSLDEFPQFINIFYGEMSLIGNRPYLPYEKEDMGKYYDDIIKTKPGLTGYWQTRGRNNLTFKDRVKLESYYSNHCSFRLDIKILFKTIAVVFKMDGAK